MNNISTLMKKIRKYKLYVCGLLILGTAALIVSASSRKHVGNSFDLADDVPRGPLVYAQFKNFPILIKQWNESKLKEKYLNGTSFDQFKNSHLALKLIERWEEFNNSLGFPLGLDAIVGTTDQSLAIAIYDIGRLDLVLVAPVSNEKVMAMKFFQNKDDFEEMKASKANYYRLNIESDNGRREQVVAFATIEGKFILSTNEELLLRTLANINGESKKDRLSDDKYFKDLSTLIVPHAMTVWVDQDKLNQDWYFKRYWLSQNVKDFKHLQAGIFDFDLQDKKWIEHREFIYKNRNDVDQNKITKDDIYSSKRSLF
jgi:hypothetical protein